MLPDFIIAGFAKNGTTYLDNLLRNHPEICMPKRTTDYSFFDNDDIFKKGIEWYKSLFNDCSVSKVIGQTSADCLFNEGSLERIKKYLPSVKLVIVVRNPIDSLYSLYWHQVRMGREYKSLKKALELEDKRIKKSYYNYKMYSYFGRSKISRMINKLYSLFDSSQILLIPFEVLINDELKSINIICDFLGVKRITDINELLKVNVSKNPARIPRYKILVRFTYYLRKFGMEKFGQYLLIKTLENKRPDKIPDDIREKLEEKLKDDIEIHKKLLSDFSNLTNE